MTYLAETLQDRKEWVIIQSAKEKTGNKDYCIWHKCPSEMKEKLRPFQISKSEGNSLPQTYHTRNTIGSPLS